MKKYCLLLLTLLVSSSLYGNLIGIHEPLRVVEREHFTFIYQAPLEAQLPALIKAFEDAYAILTPVFKTRPHQKITVLFDDSWDEHNGFATIFPRPTIAVYAADVSPGSSIYEPGDFLRGTVFHEMAHVLPMNAQYGFDASLSRIFGRPQSLGDPLSSLIALMAIPPNTLAPIWYLEGLSIWSETEFAGPGRGRGSVADMIMRMAVAENMLLRPNQWELELPEHPFGEAAYLYGMRTIQYAHETWGLERQENTPGELADSVAHSILYFFNNRARPVTGRSFEQLAHEAMNHENQRQREMIERLQQVPTQTFPPLTPERMQAREPLFSADSSRIYFIASGEAGRDALYDYEISSGTLTRHPTARVQEGISRLVAAPGSRHLYFTRLNYRGRDRVWSELIRYDPANGAIKRIDRKGRYRFPAISPDGLHLAAVRNAAGERVLLEVPLARAGQPADERALVTAPPKRQLVDPVYTPDGSALLYVLSGEGTSQIRRYDRASGRDELLVEMPGLITSPSVHPDGTRVIFSADINGVFNLYHLALESGATPRPITHVIGGIFTPAFSPDGNRLAFSSYDAHGYRLTMMDTPAGPQPVATTLPDIRTDRWTTLPANQARLAERAQIPEPADLASRPYRPLTAIRPHFWTPWLAASEDGVQGGLAVGFNDPVMLHDVLIAAGYDSGFDAPVASATWTWSGWQPVITLYGNYTSDTYTDRYADERGLLYDYDEHVGAGGFAVAWPLLDVDRSVTLTLGYHYADRRMTDSTRDDLREITPDPAAAPWYEGGEGSLWASLEWLDATAFGRSASLEDGRYISAAIDVSDPALGGDLARTRTLAQWNEYITLPWRENHVLKLHTLGGTGSGDKIGQGFFGLGGVENAMTSSSPAIPYGIGLRGYPQNYQTGRTLVIAGGGYRFPLISLYQGVSATMPVYLHQLFGEIFYEGGMAWDSSDNRNWIGSAGFEINLSTTLLRGLDLAPGIGVAYAFDRKPMSVSDADSDDDEKLQFYLSIKASVNF